MTSTTRSEKPGRKGGPKPKRTESCQDCAVENRLNIMGLPLYDAKRGLRLTNECENCNGSGRQAA